MWKITLNKSIARTYALKNYENIKPMISITKEFDEWEVVDIKKELDEMWEILTQELQEFKKRLYTPVEED